MTDFDEKLADYGQLDVREELYNQYQLPGQSIEDFVDYMAEELGKDWVTKLTRRCTSKNLTN